MILLLFSGVPAEGLVIFTTLPELQSALVIRVAPFEWLVDTDTTWPVSDSGEWPVEPAAEYAGVSGSSWSIGGGEEWEVR